MKKGIKIEGLPLYIRYDNRLQPVDAILSDLWELPAFNRDEYYTITYNPELKGWFFEDLMFGGNDIPDSLKKKLEKTNSKRK